MSWPRPTIQDLPDSVARQLIQLAELESPWDAPVLHPVTRTRWQADVISALLGSFPRTRVVQRDGRDVEVNWPMVQARIRWPELNPQTGVIELRDGRLGMVRVTEDGQVHTAPQYPPLHHSVRIVLAQRFPDDEPWLPAD